MSGKKRHYSKSDKARFSALAKDPKFHKVMREYGQGKLKSSSGDPVYNPAQARAIAASETERKKEE
jgi:hypothetical protein